MRYEDLNSKEKGYVNGVIAQFTNCYIHNNVVWSAEQIYSALCEKMKIEHARGEYGNPDFKDGVWFYPNKGARLWLVSDDAKEYIVKKCEKTYKKHYKLAMQKPPMTERIRFGIRWENKQERFYDINWGLKMGSNYEKIKSIEGVNTIPWSIKHVEEELRIKYNKDLITVLRELSKSPIEEMFYKQWIEKFYDNKNNPAIIPELCGTRRMFYCYKDQQGYYSFNESTNSKLVNFRFDFSIINTNKQKMLLIELDGNQHKTNQQRNNDSIKRAIVEESGWHVIMFTGAQIMSQMESIFEQLSDCLSYD